MGREASSLSVPLLDAKKDQFNTLAMLDSNPLEPTLILKAKEALIRYQEFSLMEHNWASQRAKSHWLIYSNDDIKFLYCLIKV